MRLRVILPLALASLFALGACGSSSPSPTASTKTTTSATPVTYEPAGVNPSKSAKMVCEPEVAGDLAEALGVEATKVTKPTWKDHVYSCTFVYPKGSFVLSTKELVSEKTTTDYFNGLKQKLGLKDNLYGLGQGAFVAKNDDVVVRKDYKVLLVDVKNVPKGANAFAPAMVRPDVATNIAAVIMSCWVGA
jgi:hypothetical protein